MVQKRPGLLAKTAETRKTGNIAIETKNSLSPILPNTWTGQRPSRVRTDPCPIQLSLPVFTVGITKAERHGQLDRNIPTWSLCSLCLPSPISRTAENRRCLMCVLCEIAGHNVAQIAQIIPLRLSPYMEGDQIEATAKTYSSNFLSPRVCDLSWPT